MISSLPRVAVIAGPTASGKSAAALALAERDGGVVINADASQVYRDLRILSARPSEAEEARAPHRLFGYLDGAEACSAARWAGDAIAAIDTAHADGLLPILVGGTGLYLRTLLDGIAPVPPIDPAIRADVRSANVADAHARLEKIDPVSAQRLHPSDTTRVARALEVAISTGRPLHAWQAERTGGIGHRIAVDAVIFLPPRDTLHARCDTRLITMFAEGAIEEVEVLLARNLPADAPALRAIGVPEITALVQGHSTRDQALAATQGATRRYAKRQYTWFRHQTPAEWKRLDCFFNGSIDGIF